MIASLMIEDMALDRLMESEIPRSEFIPFSVGVSAEYLCGEQSMSSRNVSRHRSLPECKYADVYSSSYHGCGSCSMGTVVDTDLRVKGVGHLRIVDVSVIPIPIGAHIQAAVYALAEQAAVIISQQSSV